MSMSPAVKISFVSGAIGAVVAAALAHNPLIGAAMGVLFTAETAAVLTLIEALLTPEDA